MALRPLFPSRSGGATNPAVSADKTTTSGSGVKPNSTVTVYKNGTQAGTATANGSGAWSYTFGSALVVGDVVTYDAVLTSPAYTVPSPTPVAPTAPAAPTITLTPGAAQISIAWTDGATNGAAITSHKLYRGTVSGARALVGTINTGSPYVDTSLTNGTPYFYSLSAVNSAGEGVQSAQASATPVVAATFTPPAPFHNFNASYLANWKAARDGTASPTIAVIGDSTDAGTGATFATSWPSQLASKLAAGTPAIPTDGSFAYGATPNPKFSFGGWATSANMIRGGGAGTKCKLTSDFPFDRADICYLGYSNTTGTFSVSADGGASVLSVNTVQDIVIRKVTASWSDGKHNYIELTDSGAAAGACYVTSIRLYDSTTKRTTMMNFGIPGASSRDIANNASFSIVSQSKGAAPALTILENGMINDYKGGIALSTFQTNMQNAITAAKATGDCIVRISNDDMMSTANSAGLLLSDYWNAAEALALSNNCIFYRTAERLGATWAIANTNGYMNDPDHPNVTGYGLIATDMNALLAGI